MGVTVTSESPRAHELTATARPVWAWSLRAAAGLLLVGAGTLFLMGVITAEALYDGLYTTRDSEISDLGATRPPDSISYQPSSAIFNAVMIAMGAMIITSSLLMTRVGVPRATWISLAILGIGALGVGVFPGNRDPYHGIFALVAFIGGGIAALLSARGQPVPMRWVSLTFGAVCLGSLVFAMAASSTSIYEEMGDGGIERWVAYPVVLWMVAFGGFLLQPARSITHPLD